MIPLRLAIESCGERGEPLHILQIDIDDRFTWEAASKKVGKGRALLLLCLVLRTSFSVHWAAQTDSAEIGMEPVSSILAGLSRACHRCSLGQVE